MWTAQLSRRELIELVLTTGKIDESKLKRATGITVPKDSQAFQVFWEREHRIRAELPNLIVVPDDASLELLAALNASPQTPAPITALCRVLTQSEALQIFESSLLDMSDEILPAIVALSIAEATTHADGRLTFRQVTPAVCKRTLSFAWGKAISARIPAQAIEKLPSRWMDTYSIINSISHTQPIGTTISSLITPLSVCAQLASGMHPKEASGRLALASFLKNRTAQDHAWRELSQSIDISISLNSLAATTREERGNFLQQALRIASRVDTEQSNSACAFLAAQVAPGSLEHLEILRNSAHPAVGFWYVMYAALQAPTEILAANGGIGLRILRDLAKNEEQMARPSADIAYIELKALERVGVDNLSRKFGHIGEVEVELVPLVTSSFSFQRQSKRSESSSSMLPSVSDTRAHDLLQSSLSAAEHLRKLAAQINELVKDLPDFDKSLRQSSKRSGQTSGRKKKNN